MQVNGTNIFLGAYAERHPDQFSRTALNVSEEKAKAITTGIQEALSTLNMQNKGVKVSVSKEDIEFLCSEEGFQKMKLDAEDLYLKNINQQKEIAKDRNPDDLFWNNTGNQWLTFSESLYKNGFYDGMSDDEVKKFEDTLSYITSGMDRLSRSQYLTGIEFGSIDEEFKFFMSSSEAMMELESAKASLQYMSATLLPKEQQEDFNKLVDMFYQHNEEVLSEYNNPMESFNKVIAGIHSKKNPYFNLLDEVAEKPVGEYKHTVMLGMIEKSEKEKGLYRDELQSLFDKLKRDGNKEDIWERIKEKFLNYSTDGSNDEEFRNYVFGQSQYLFEHIRNCWNRLFALGGK